MLFVLFGELAACGVVQAMTWNGKLLWFRILGGGGRPFGPYVNGTHFAGVMALAVPWMAGFAWIAFRRARSGEWKKTSAPLVAAAAFLCLVAGIWAGSRVAALLMGLSLTLLAIATFKTGRVRRWVVVSSFAAWGIGTLLVSLTPLGDRFQYLLAGADGGVMANDRVLAWRASLPVVRDFPLTGIGFGAFRFVFPSYLPPGEVSAWFQLHNDYLEILLDGGVVAAVLLVWLTVAFWARAVRVHSHTDGLAAHPSRLGALLGLAALSMHAFVDFNHQIPANALLFVTVAAIAVAGKRPAASGGPT
jgi:O-antigen ligase